AHYRSLLCENQIEEYDLLRTHMEFTTETSISSQQLPPLTIFNAINFAAGAWDQVKQRVIQSSWQKSGILPLTVQPMTNEAEENLESEVINLVAQLPSEEPMNTVREYIDLEEKKL
ncbi:13_t:CDS:2, partial [Paraglomus occultum]